MKTGSAFIIISLVAAFVLSLAGNGFAATIDVTTTDDETNSDGDCSLREAIISANTDSPGDACTPGSGADEINIPAGTYTLSIPGTNEDEGTAGDLDITADLTLTGDGADKTIIDGGGIERVFDIKTSVSATFTDLTITGGRVTLDHTGGGIASGDYSNVTIERCALTGNTVASPTVSSGGGIYGGKYGTLTIDQSTISNNTVSSIDIGLGGGIMVGGYSTLIATNSTISGNSITGAPNAAGGGISIDPNRATVELYNVTIADNSVPPGGEGGGVNIGSSSVFVIMNSIIADNAGGSSPDCEGPVTSLSYSLIEDTTNCTVSSGTPVTGDPSLDVLANNGGSTQTHKLKAGSIAIDAGDPSGCVDADGAVLKTDQRGSGYGRPKDGNGDGKAVCDIGAVERLGTLTAPGGTLPRKKR